MTFEQDEIIARRSLTMRLALQQGGLIAKADQARSLALRLGVGDLVYPPICHGRRNGCICGCIGR